MMGEKQKETLRWLDELEQYAKEKQLSMRILDSIAECRENMASENVDWNQTGLQIEELLDSVEKKVLPAVMKVEEGDDEVSVAAVENELKNMAQKCHAENEASLNNFESRKNIILQNLFVNLQDLTRVEAHLKELKEKKSYQAFFRRVETEYHNNILIMVRELLQSIRNNHGQMMERMKSMFQSINARRHGLSSERLYREYDTKAAELGSKIQNEIERMETGEEEIQNLERRTWDNISLIVRKTERKRKMLAWLPVVIIVCALLIGVVSAYATISQVAKEVAESEMSNIQTGDSAEVLSKTENILSKLENILSLGKGSEDLGGLAGTAAAGGTVGVVGVFILLLVVLIYGFYLLLLKRWSSRRICDKCGAYLNVELTDFVKGNTLLLRMNATINAAMEEYERQYGMILNDLLAGSRFNPESEEKKEANRFGEIKNSWNTIKYR